MKRKAKEIRINYQCPHCDVHLNDLSVEICPCCEWPIIPLPLYVQCDSEDCTITGQKWKGEYTAGTIKLKEFKTVKSNYSTGKAVSEYVGKHSLTRSHREDGKLMGQWLVNFGDWLIDEYKLRTKK